MPTAPNRCDLPVAVDCARICKETIMMLYVINAVAALFVLVGYHVAFRQRLVRAWGARLRSPGERSNAASRPQGASQDPEGIASVFRMAGVMIMAFSFTAGAFANLIAYYTAAGRV
jgi:hypothetical protein